MTYPKHFHDLCVWIDEHARPYVEMMKKLDEVPQALAILKEVVIKKAMGREELFRRAEASKRPQ